MGEPNPRNSDKTLCLDIYYHHLNKPYEKKKKMLNEPRIFSFTSDAEYTG